MPRRMQLEGQRFGRLVVSSWDGSAKRDGAWLCKCDCGGGHIASSSHLTSGRVISCGCVRPRHGGKGTRAYAIWRGILDRCSRENHKNWPDYGGRGISVCDRWHEFPNFLEDMGHPPSGGTIERRDNDGDYTPSNCYWADRKTQSRNTRRSIVIEYRGRSQSLTAWAEEFGANYWKLHSRHKLGWSPERMFADF